MKTVILLSACILLAIIAENSASPLDLQDSRHYQGGSGSGSRQKPGSCYRPGFGNGRKRRSAEEHLIEKRQTQGSNPWRPPRPTQAPRPQCYNDYDCSGNKKCCTGACSTPSFVG